MIEDLSRLDNLKMTYYKETYKNSKSWDGSPLNGQKIIVYCEQGIGDTIQFLRYVKYLDGEVLLHCHKSLHRLVMGIEGVKGVLDKDDDNLPDHDCHVLSMSLPFKLQRVEADVPYIHVKSESFLEPVKCPVGIAWEGNPTNPRNEVRSMPLKLFKQLDSFQLYMLQDQIHSQKLLEEAEDLELFGTEITDFLDTAKFMASMDSVVSVDTAVLHLAGAMGKKGYGLLDFDHDVRWGVRKWYPSLKLFKQDRPGDWQSAFNKLKRALYGN